jgi:aminoglycoside phosphotransferase (APT) family kinase protein
MREARYAVDPSGQCDRDGVNEATKTLVRWVEDETGATVDTCVPHSASGRSRTLWRLDVRYPGQPSQPLLLRQDVDHGPFSGTTFTLGREARVVQSLQDTGVPVPRIHAISSDEKSVLLELVPGSANLDVRKPADRQALDDFILRLARLHALDPTKLALPIPVPTTPQDHALIDLAEHRASYLNVCRPNPVADEAIVWLEDHAPGTARTALVHGDAGPGNFLHRAGTVTALIDWEMTHVGDPMDDLAWLWFRTRILRNDTGLRGLYDRYSQASSAAIEPDRINYFCVLVLFRCLVASSVRMEHGFDSATIAPVERTTRWLRSALNDQRASGKIGASGDLPPLPDIANSTRG